MSIPKEISQIIQTLISNGFEAYAVGGCVRDMIIGTEPKDWDICTSALPRQVKECFHSYTVIETGIKYGTVTVIINGTKSEITTYRTDGGYNDLRHPADVNYSTSLKDDLSRRDFTVNAMALSAKGEIMDFFGGQEDIKKRIIRCVGNADKRFNEDALRILRALRFASVLDFSIDGDTSEAIRKNKELLRFVSAERIRDELMKLLCGKGVYKILMEYSDVLAVFIPEILPCVGLKQTNPWHIYDVWQHTAYSVANSENNKIIRLAMLLHDLGKPDCFTCDNGVCHFYGHPAKSKEIAESILKRLRFDNKTSDYVSTLVKYHDEKIPADKISVKKWLNKIGANLFADLLYVKEADCSAKNPGINSQQTEYINSLRKLFDEIIANNECFSIKTLKINGDTLIKLGAPQGAYIGKLLDELLNMVINEQIPNDENTLKSAAEKLIKG